MSNFERTPWEGKQRDAQELHYINKANKAMGYKASRSKANAPPAVPAKDRQYVPASPSGRTTNQSGAYPILGAGGLNANPPTATARKPVPASQPAAARRPVPKLDNTNTTTPKPQGARPILKDGKPTGQYATPGAIPTCMPGKDGKFRDNGATAERPRSRAGSITTAVANVFRRGSDAVKQKAELLNMDPRQRDAFAARFAPTGVRQVSEEREFQRRADPLSRPFEQKEALLKKNERNTHVVQRSGHGILAVEADYHNMVATSEFNARMNAGNKERRDKEILECLANGEHPSPPVRRMPTATLELNALERMRARISDQGVIIDNAPLRPINKPTLSAADKLILKFGNSLNKLQGHTRSRSNTMDSDKSFTDAAPAGTMKDCKVCNRSTLAMLKDDTCEPCRKAKLEEFHRLAKEVWNSDRLASAQREQSNANPDSPPFMRLVKQKKIRRVRYTIYADPGNPFLDDKDRNSVAILSLPFKPGLDTGPPTPGAAPLGMSFNSGMLNAGPSDNGSKSPEDGRANPGSGPDIRSPKPRRSGTPTMVRVDRRKSLAAVAEDSGHAPPKSPWRRESLRMIFPIQREQRRDVRSSKFYDFYDGLLNDYEDGDLG
ncbi:hypothetical protein LTR62_003786 [Meristemomyces frigidus]|uniref:Uncharacterized protein n=1 Tax=Meristemomyces frigidus TaxID=1508187 RepID=A0AAN7TEJ9_9PEZI|nr:hypothetical protein LTR62_003786 [Meristemomyces frigidus]